MGGEPPNPIPELLMGLAPAGASNCPRCGSRTSALANGRGRLEFCAQCGTLDIETSEGLSLLRLRDLSLPSASMLPKAMRELPQPGKKA